VRSRTIKRIPDTTVFEVRYAGDVSYRFRLDTLDALERILPGGQLHRLLINYTSAWPYPRSQPRAAMEFGLRLGRMKFAPGARIALLNSPQDVAAKTQATAIPGGHLIRQFVERDLAIAWLTEPS
jgi:hypothetical protein